MTEHSSATKERFEIPRNCVYCNSVGGPQFDGLDGGLARVKCRECKRVWRIDPTPVHVIADRNATKLAAFDALLAAAEDAKEVLTRLRLEGPTAISFINLDGAITTLRAAIAQARGEA